MVRHKRNMSSVRCGMGSAKSVKVEIPFCTRCKFDATHITYNLYMAQQVAKAAIHTANQWVPRDIWGRGGTLVKP